MMDKNHITKTYQGSLLDQELKAIYAEQHSPSSKDIHQALGINAKTEIGFQTSYHFSPKAQTAEIATKAIHALHARAPVLLEAILDAIASNKPGLTIEIPNSSRPIPQPSVHKSGHQYLEDMPYLIRWLTS